MRSESQKTRKQTSLPAAKATTAQTKLDGRTLTPAHVLQLQKAIGNRAVVQMLKANGQPSATIQRAPADFKDVTPSRLRPWPWESGTPWTDFYAILKAYANTNENSPDRNRVYKQLLESVSNTRAELDSQDIPKNAKDAAILEEQIQFLKNLAPRIQDEGKAMMGNLNMQALPQTSDEPEFLEEQKEEEVKGAKTYKIVGGVFKQQVDIWDDAATVIDQVPAGIVCEIYADNTAPAGKDAKDVWRVKPNLAIGNSDNFQNFKDGYVEKTAVVLTNRLKQNGGLAHQAETRPLFPHPPVMQDVTQGGIGDCYLLAATQSIVKSKPDHFPSHMVDNGDTVTVRLYDVVDNLGVKTFTPKYITVHKTTVVKTQNSASAYASGPVWVHMLEKAYAAAKFSGTQTEEVPLKKAAYGTIDGGFGDVAMEHLLGKAAGSKEIKSNSEKYDADKFAGTMLGPLMQITNIDEILNDMQKFSDECAKYKDKEQLRSGDIVKIFKDLNYSAPLQAAAKQVAEQILPGKRGTSQYTPEQMDVYNEIKARVDANQPVTVGSKKKIVSGQAGVGLNSEEQGKGLVGTHAYSILEYQDTNGVLKVKLRNPWGSYGRKYEQKGQKVKAKEDKNAGEFWLDLHDLTKRFTKLYYEA